MSTRNSETITEPIYDVCVVGHVCWDRNVIDGRRMPAAPGGAAYYSSLAYLQLGLRVAVLTKVTEQDENGLLVELRAQGADVINLPTKETTVFENAFSPENPDVRLQRALGAACPFQPEDLKNVRARFYHFGPLLSGDLAVEAIAAAHRRGRVAIDVQGLLREGGEAHISLVELKEGAAFFRHADIVSGDAEEIQLSVSTRNLDAAFSKLTASGPGEIIATRGSAGAVVWHEGTIHGIPAFPPSVLRDTTGCGDTFLAGYVAHRQRGLTPYSSGLFAAAMASIKLESSGPLGSSLEEVRRRLALEPFAGASPQVAEAVRRIRAAIACSSVPEDFRHGENTVSWLIRLRPDADIALKLAALGHDIERADERRKVRRKDFPDYDSFKSAHARQSAALLDVLLDACGVSGEIRREVKRLVALHEVGGDPRSDLLQDADSLSFFEVNLPLFAAREGTEVTRKRCLWGFQRLSALGRARLTDITHHKPELRRLLTDLVGRADDPRSEILSAGSE